MYRTIGESYMPRLTVDITEEVLRNGYVEGGKRLANFLDRVFEEDGASLELEPLDGPQTEKLIIFRRGDTLSIDGLGRERFAVADRLILDVGRWRDTYDHRDGSAVFVTHVLRRADLNTQRRLLPIIPSGDVRVRSAEGRKAWLDARDATIQLLISQQLRGLPCLSALTSAIADRATILIRGSDDSRHPIDEIISEGERSYQTALMRLESLRQFVSETFALPSPGDQRSIPRLEQKIRRAAELTPEDLRLLGLASTDAEIPEPRR